MRSTEREACKTLGFDLLIYFGRKSKLKVARNRAFITDFHGCIHGEVSVDTFLNITEKMEKEEE